MANAELHAKEAPDRVRELEKWGAVFDRTADAAFYSEFRGHRYPRLAHVGDRTGLEMIRPARSWRPPRDRRAHGTHDLVDLERWYSRGRALLRTRTRSFQNFSREAIVLATGGIGAPINHKQQLGVYRRRHSLAYEAGAELIDMEFIQFHPTEWSGAELMEFL